MNKSKMYVDRILSPDGEIVYDKALYNSEGWIVDEDGDCVESVKQAIHNMESYKDKDYESWVIEGDLNGLTKKKYFEILLGGANKIILDSNEYDILCDANQDLFLNAYRFYMCEDTYEDQSGRGLELSITLYSKK